jgi:hypothetical protein
LTTDRSAGSWVFVTVQLMSSPGAGDTDTDVPVPEGSDVVLEAAALVHDHDCE